MTETTREEILKPTTLAPEGWDDGQSIHRWSVILAGGEGKRLRHLTRVWFGQDLPKQFCAFAGRRSMLEETADRARQISNSDRIITVIGAEHWKFLPRQSSYSCGRIIEQPANRETAAAILLCAAWAVATDPLATLLILPSDHFVCPDGILIPQLISAVRLAEELDDKIVLLGAEANSAEMGYGWIIPTKAGDVSKVGATFRRVVGFEEEPTADKAKRFFLKGYLWNTMMFAVKATTLWNLSRQFLPELTEYFQVLRRVREVAERGKGQPDLTQQALEHIYGNIPAVSFSRVLLSNATRHLVVLPMREVIWR
ncbi:MAG TPA: sugar phosphate nucleotidyltransferase [Acidobacteriota bacterium]|nr:sugar phosphate nucleotidyltransferase [Acidobacteriota bacterium]